MPICHTSKRLNNWITAAALTLSATAAQAASFPCDKASTPVEKAICGSPEISSLDEYLGRYYAAARMGLQHAEFCFVADQRTWVRTVRDACKDAACLKAVYLHRLAVLHAVQPGATSLRTVELPSTASLVWIVPPAADQVAAPRDAKTSPLSVTGKIVNDVARGDGYVVQTDGGTKHVIASLMFLDQRTSAALDQIAQSQESKYEVIGRAESTSSAVKSFAASQCTFIYRIPK
jgi:uncharacterized protein